MKATNLQLFTAQLLFEYNNCNNFNYFPLAHVRMGVVLVWHSTKYQMTRYDVTVSNFLWIADCCIMRRFSMRIIRIFCFLKNTYVFLRILFYHTRILELCSFRLAKLDCCINKTANINVKNLTV